MKRLKKFITAILCLLPMMSYAQNQVNLIPKPQKLVINQGSFLINENSVIITPDKFAGEYLQQRINSATGYNIPVLKSGSQQENYIKFDISENKEIPKEGYKLSVTSTGILVEASHKAGAFYAVQTILQLLPTTIYGNTNGFEEWKIQAVTIEDYPRFSYRGMMLDVSRTFFDKDFIYKYIEWLAYHKLNTFHWHLTDDNGWRIEIKKYPLLTKKGAWRGPNEVLPQAYGSGDKRYGGFYSQKEIREIIKFAADRNIEIIPEIDMPGHSKAVVYTYPQIGCKVTDKHISANGEFGNIWCVGREENYKMLDDIIKEVAALFPSDYIHIGGDEAQMKNWEVCPVCQEFMKEEGMKEEIQLLNYFVRELEEIVTKYGKKMAGWDEILDGGELDENTLIYAWRGIEAGEKAMKIGQPTVMQISEYCYFDMKHSLIERGHNWAGIIPLEKVYSFDPIGSFENATDEQKKFIIGVQGALWTELLNKPARFVEYQNYPRTVAMAEVGWTNQEYRDYEDFYKRLTETHFERLYNMDIAFRVPYPTVNYVNNTLKIELPYQSAVVRYTTDGSEPTYSSEIYKGDIVTYEPERFKFATFYNNSLKSITVQADNLPEPNYLTPQVEIESSLGHLDRFPIKNVTDYNFKTYWRTDRTGRAGDYITYKFKEPVKCSTIIVDSGIPNIAFYGVTMGYVEYSYDGKNWIKGEQFKDDKATINPKESVKAVKIVLTGENDAFTIAVQDLKIF